MLHILCMYVLRKIVSFLHGNIMETKYEILCETWGHGMFPDILKTMSGNMLCPQVSYILFTLCFHVLTHRKLMKTYHFSQYTPLPLSYHELCDCFLANLVILFFQRLIWNEFNLVSKLILTVLILHNNYYVLCAYRYTRKCPDFLALVVLIMRINS